MVQNLPANAGDLGSIPGLGRSPGEGNGYPLPYSCLGNPMNRGALWAIVHRVTKESDVAEHAGTYTVKYKTDHPREDFTPFAVLHISVHSLGSPWCKQPKGGPLGNPILGVLVQHFLCHPGRRSNTLVAGF